MKKSQSELTYLRSAAQDATPAGLVIILYDLLVHDLEQAVAAIADHNIEARTAEIKHAFMVLQQLEGSLDAENGGPAASNLAAFYSSLRCKILEAQVKANSETLRRQIELVLDVRQAWQQVDKPNLGSDTAVASAGTSSQPAGRSMAAAAAESRSMNWTA